MTTTYINVNVNINAEIARDLLASSFQGTVLEGTPPDDDCGLSGIRVSPDMKSFEFDEGMLPDAGARATDGASKIYAYALGGCTVFLEIGGLHNGIHLCPEGTTIKTLLRDFDTGDFDMAEHLASWGFDGTPDEADADATDVRVWCEPCYYEGTIGAPVGHYVRDDRYDTQIFPTVFAAKNWILEAGKGTYFLANGEAGRPSYTVCK